MAKVVIAHSDVQARGELRAALAQWGYQVIEAADGHEVLRLYEYEPCPRVAIIERNVPGIDGFALCKRLKIPGQAPIVYTILLLDGHDPELIREAFAAGADDYLTAPIVLEQLQGRLRAGVRITSYEENLQEQGFRVRLECYRALTELAETRDQETGNHLKRLSAFSFCLSERLGMPTEFVHQMAMFAPMHDIGKVGIPDSILRAPRKLTHEEIDIMKSHPALGWNILEGKASLEIAADIAYTHHECFDGSGYPRGLAGEDIPLCGRIVTVSDVYDALRSRRVYKQGWEHVAACDFIVAQSGKRFDPRVIQAFTDVESDMESIFDALQDPF